MRIAIVTEIPAPFRIPLFNALESVEDVSVTALFLRASNPQRPYELYADEYRFGWRVLRGFSLTRGSRWLVVNVGVAGALRRAQPEVVLLGGWNQPAFWQALAIAKATGRPAIAWVESTLRDARPNRGVYERAKRAFLRACDGYVVPGCAAEEYLVSLGITGDPVRRAPNAVDPLIFGERVAALRARRSALRKTLGLEGFVILSVGRLTPEKGVATLVRAVAGLSEAQLAVVGVGPEEARLRALADQEAPGRVHFPGFVPRDELAAWYAAADVVALPSLSEQWGMVLNEAAVAGLPLVASAAAGGTWDLVEHGRNGFRFPPGDEGALRDALERLASDVPLRQSAGARSREIAARFKPEIWADALAGLARDLLR